MSPLHNLEIFSSFQVENLNSALSRLKFVSNRTSTVLGAEINCSNVSLNHIKRVMYCFARVNSIS